MSAKFKKNGIKTLAEGLGKQLELLSQTTPPASSIDSATGADISTSGASGRRGGK